MRIAISGAQSVGKTTLINALRSEKSLKDYTFCTEVTRRVGSYGLPINEDGTDITQRLIMQEHIVNYFMNDNMICDRSALDGMVYSEYLWGRQKISWDTMHLVNKIYEKLIGKYDLNFYIAPEFEIENDGVRSVDKKFRDDIVKLFDAKIERLKDKEIEVVYISGSVRERVEQVLQKIEWANNEHK